MEKTAGYVESECDFDNISTEVLASHWILPAVDSIIVRRIGAEVMQGLDCVEEIYSLRAKRADSPSFSIWKPAYRALAAASALLSGEPRFETELSTLQKGVGGVVGLAVSDYV